MQSTPMAPPPLSSFIIRAATTLPVAPKPTIQGCCCNHGHVRKANLVEGQMQHGVQAVASAEELCVFRVALSAS